MKQWYLVMTKPRQELVAYENLERQNFDPYLPKCLREKRVRGKYQNVTEPLFPRYLFVHLDNENQDWAPIRSTLGVVKLVKFGVDAAIVSDSIIESIKNKENSDGKVRVGGGEQLFKKGDTVQILEGSMSGMDAIFSHHLGADRVVVLLSLLGQDAQPVNMKRDDISVA